MLTLSISSLFAQDPQIYTVSGIVSNDKDNAKDAVLMIVDDDGNITVGIISGDDKFAISFDKGNYTYKGDKIPYVVQSNDGKYKLTFSVLEAYTFELAGNGKKERFYIPLDKFRVKTEAEGGFKLSIDGSVFIKNHFPSIFSSGSNL